MAGAFIPAQVLGILKAGGGHAVLWKIRGGRWRLMDLDPARKPREA